MLFAGFSGKINKIDNSSTEVPQQERKQFSKLAADTENEGEYKVGVEQELSDNSIQPFTIIPR